MSADDVIADLRRQLKARNDDNEELKLDKRDLRSHMAKLKEDLEAATKGLQDELRETRAELGAVRKENERLRKAMQPNHETVPGVVGASNAQVMVATPPSSLGRESSILQEPPAFSRTTFNSSQQNIKGRSPSVQIIEPPTAPYTFQGRGKRKAVSSNGPPQETHRSARTVTVASSYIQPITHPNSGSGTLNVPDHIHFRPRIKVVADRAIVLPVDVLVSFLRDTPPLRIVPPPSNLLILRQLLQTAYGCSPKQNVQYIEANRNASRRCLRVLVLPRYDIHPSMPLQPGHSGLVIAGKYNPPRGEGPYSLFRKDLKGSSTWLYMGEYDWNVAGKMSATVFRGQGEAVKQGLASEIVTPKKNTSEYYLSMRARMALRKAGQLPTSNKTLERELIRQELLRLNAGKPLELTQEDVISSLSRGEEAIEIILVRCVSYDRAFAKDLEAKWCASKRRGGRTKGSKTNNPIVKRRNSPFTRAKQAAPSIQPGIYTSGASTSTYKRHAIDPRSSDQWATSIIDADDSLNPRPIRGMRSTWDPSTGQRVRKSSDACPGEIYQVIDLVQDGVNPKDILDVEDTIMDDLDDGYLSYASEDAFDDPPYISG